MQIHHHANINPSPGQRKRFDVEHMRRIPVMQDEQTREYLMLSNHQSRVIPQALSEFFGTIPDIDRVELHLEEDKERLVIAIKHRSDEKKHHTFFVALDDIQQVSEHPYQGFKATKMSDGLLKLYRFQVLKEGQDG